MVDVSLLPSAAALGRGSGNRSVPALRCAFPVLSIFARIIPLLSLKNSSGVSRREFARETLQIIVLFRTDPAGIGQNRMNSLPNSLKAGNRTIQRRRRAPRGESGRCAINRGCAFLGATRVLLTWIRCPADPFRALDATAPVLYGARDCWNEAAIGGDPYRIFGARERAGLDPVAVC